jgi:peptidoglycan/xylan/chitin deacetylase (PgdA/CDA1 family)
VPNDSEDSLLRALRTDLQIQLLESSPRARAAVRLRYLIKCLLAALCYHSGLTSWILSRIMRSDGAALILGYHGVSRDSRKLLSRGHALSNLREQLLFLRRSLRPVRLEEIIGPISRGEAPPAATFAVTFDDGLVNHATLAVPLLEELGIPATFFVPSGLVDSGDDLWVSAVREMVYHWPGDRVASEPGLWPDLPLGNDAARYEAFFRMKQALKTNEGVRREVLERLARRAGGFHRPPEQDRVISAALLQKMVRAGITVGGHSRTHPILSGLGLEAAREEIKGCREDLERILGVSVVDFAFPNGRFGDFDESTCRLVAETGFRCAVITEPGMVRRGDDRLALRRCLPDNVPALLASFDLMTRAWQDRWRAADSSRPLTRRHSYLTPSRSEQVA